MVSGGDPSMRRFGHPVRRIGHSLAELLVAFTLLSLVLAVTVGATSFAHRRTLAALRSQEALAVTAQVLDSLTAAPSVVPGERVALGLRTVWSVSAAADGLDIEVRTGALEGGRLLAALSGFWMPKPALLPSIVAEADAAPADSAPADSAPADSAPADSADASRNAGS